MPREVSLFPVDAAGELNFGASSRPPPPEFTGIAF
jgi:hypothetical protein